MSEQRKVTCTGKHRTSQRGRKGPLQKGFLVLGSYRRRRAGNILIFIYDW